LQNILLNNNLLLCSSIKWKEPPYKKLIRSKHSCWKIFVQWFYHHLVHR